MSNSSHDTKSVKTKGKPNPGTHPARHNHHVKPHPHVIHDDMLFRSKAPTIMKSLMEDFNLTEIQAAAILGNIGC